MTIKVREWKKGRQVGFEVDIRFTYPDGAPYRQRVKAPVESKSAAKRWGEARERELLMRPSPVFLEKQEETRKEVPTLREFGPRFVDNYAKANRHKASGVAAKESIFQTHLYPVLGDRKLDTIADEDVQRLKVRLVSKSHKTVNNVLSVLNKALKVALRWKVISTMPCTIELVRVSNVVPRFYEFAEYERLMQAAARIDSRTLALVVLGGDAGLRRGEMIGLQWCDVDLRRRVITVQRSVWKGIVDSPKSGRGRVIPMTDALADALLSHRHLCGERVFYDNAGQPVTEKILRGWLAAAQRRAGLQAATGALHILRHTFCSHLAMGGAPAKAIQELAGHEDLSTTLRYMHLSPAARESAIAVLNRRASGRIFGEILETGGRTAQISGN
ncbi:MAG TPA: tyrosine-type recombinase/integrase [Polyangiaceae bacterium]|jgi:integrase|nr:tyrosine-type recombinase/integrase [Polyangiaceae bacterium]